MEAGVESSVVGLVGIIKEAVVTEKVVQEAHVVEDAAQLAKPAETAEKVAEDVPKYARNKYKALTPKEKADTLAKDSNCVYCGKPSTTADHVRSQKQDWVEGGWKDSRDVRSSRVNDPANLSGACRPCNSSKGSKELGTEWTPPNKR